MSVTKKTGHSEPIFSRLLALVFVLSCTTAVQAANSIEEALKTLTGKNYQLKAMAIDTLAQQKNARAEKTLRALLEGKLYYAKRGKQLYFMHHVADQYTFTPLVTGEVKSQTRKRGFKKVKINNRLRSRIRQALAMMQLQHDDARIRLAAVQELLKKPNTATSQQVSPLIATETDSRVRAAMQTLVAVSQLGSTEPQSQQAAIKTLANSLNSTAMNALRAYNAPNDELAEQAQAAIDTIDAKRRFYGHAETIFFGLSLGSVLALAAIGLAITFGVMGVINMAHGELIMIGAYTTYVVQLLMPEHIGLSVLVAIPAAFLVSALFGMLIELTIIRHLYGRPLETLLATFGVSLVLQQLVRSIFSPLNRSVETPAWMSGAWQINEVLALTWNRFYIILFCLAVFSVLIAVMKKTSLGLQVRAVAQNRQMARAMGVRSKWVDALTFGLGSGIAGLAGVALSMLTNVGPNLGQAYIIDSFMVVVFGGVGNLWGTLVAGMSLGIINKILEPWAGAVLAKILVLVFIILFIQKRPKGLFPQKGRAADD